MAVKHLFASIPVRSREQAVIWYGRLVGRPPDLVPNDNEAAWRLTDTAWICVVADAAAGAGSARHTLLVDDIDAFLAAAAERGIASGPVETMDNDVRHAYITDPDGNRLQVGQPP